jgi:cytochrome b6-f complex iron-sulfur subunit
MQSRRRFLREGLTGLIAFVVVGCSPSHRRSLPAPTTTTQGFYGFGDRLDAGNIDDIVAAIAASHEPRYLPGARAYVSPFPASKAGTVHGVYPGELTPVLEAGLVVLYQRCTHLGCRVPWCASSQYFECPCHAARFDRVGEQRAGPAPRGMDLMKASIERGRLVIDTGTIYPGVPIGTDTTHQAPAGPFCVR